MEKLFEQLCFGCRKDHYQEIREWKNARSRRKLYIWGTGSVANGVLKELERRGISVHGCFVNVPDYKMDERVAQRNLPVFTLEQMLAQREELAVIIGHSHYELADSLRQYPQIKKVWLLNNVARDDTDITESFLKEHAELFEKTYEQLQDELSRKNMTAYLNAQLTRDDGWILDLFEKNSTYFQNDVIQLSDHEVYLDLGAYDGESMKKFMDACSDFKQILAVEVQSAEYQKLVQEWGSDSRISIYHTGIGSCKGNAYFYFDGQSTHITPKDLGKGILTPVTTVDAICAGISDLSLVKICIGNSILPLLEGARHTLRKHLPRLIIAAGIDKRALADYIPKIEELAGCGRYQYYLRFTNAMEECLVLYAVPKEEQNAGNNAYYETTGL